MDRTKFSTLSTLHIERDLSNNINTEDILNVYLPKKIKIK